MEQLHDGFTLFMSLVVEAMPFLLAGVVLSSALLQWVDERHLVALLPRQPLLGAVAGSCIGFLFPVCECGNVPVARRLLLQRAPTPVAIAFLLAAPAINPISIWATWVAFRDQPEVVLWRVLFSFAIAVGIACLFGVQKDARAILHPQLARRATLLAEYGRATVPSPARAPVPAALQAGNYLLGQSLRLETAPVAAPTAAATAVPRSLQGWQQFASNVVQELRELGTLLVLGSAIAAAIQVLAPREFVASLGQGAVTSVLAMMLMAILVAVCSTVDAFFALSFAANFTTGSLLAFLVLGPLVDLKSIGLLLSVLRARVAVYIFAIAAQLTFVFALTYSYLT